MTEEQRRQAQRDAGWRYRHTEKGRRARRRALSRYRRSEKGRKMKAKSDTKYEHSEKGHKVRTKALAKYHRSEKGRSKRRVNDSLRRAREAGNGGSHTVREIELMCATSDWQCFYQSPRCTGREPYSLTPGTSHIDHKIPVSRHGSEDISNLVLSCPSCNHWKKDKTDAEFFKLIARLVSPPPLQPTPSRARPSSGLVSNPLPLRRAPSRPRSRQRPARQSPSRPSRTPSAPHETSSSCNLTNRQ